MDRGHLTPTLGRLYTEEVRHLHSLWHCGPPRSPNTNPSLRPATCTAFKKEAKNKMKSNGRAIPRRIRMLRWMPGPISPLCRPLPNLWPPASAKEQARVLADQAQLSGLKACEDFFSKKDDSDEGDEEEKSMDEDEESGEVVFKFFLGLFERDGKLREYYEKNWEKGEFSCLVCWSLGVKKWKRLGDCVRLIQHSNSISKT